VTYYIAVDPVDVPVKKFEDYSITIGAIFGLIILVSATVGGIVSIVKLTIAANNLANSFKVMDDNIAKELKQVSDRVDGGFKRIDAEWIKLDKRLYYHDARIKDLELWAHKQGFIPRNYFPGDLHSSDRSEIL
jgi:hypothetical protein